MADDAAVLDAPVLDGDVTDVQVDDNALDTGVTADSKDDAIDVQIPEVKGDERVMPQWIKNLKATDPLAFKAAKADFFGKRSLDEKLKDFDLDGTKGWLEEHGGREAIVSTLTELQGKAQELDGIASKMANGDPSLISDLIASSPEGFAKLAPVVAEQWAKSDPEGWSAAMSGVMAATIQQSGIPMFLERMALMFEVGKTDQIPAMLEQLKEWSGSFQQKAQAPRTQQTQAPKDDGRASALDQKEREFFNREMGAAVDTFRQPLISKELDSFFKRRPNDGDAKDLAINTVKTQVIDRLKADQKYQDSLNALWARKDRDGALKLIKSRETAAIQEIAPKVGRTIFGNPAAPVVQKPAGTQAKVEAGFSFTDKPPRPELIDRRQTTDAMIMRGKFILKDGQKLTLEA